MYIKDKITTKVQNILGNINIAPIIIKVRPNGFHDIKEMLYTYIGELNIEFLDSYDFPLFGDIKTFNMISTVCGRWLIEELSQERNVEKIYPNIMVNALSKNSVIPEFKKLKEGIFTVKIKDIEEKITTVEYTKKLIGANEAYKSGYFGNGITVAVIDTGVYKKHPQFSGKDVKEYHIGLERFDKNGHGTWVSSCICGNPAIDNYFSKLTGKTIKYSGIAMNSNLVSIKALGKVIGTGSLHNIIKALEICYTNNVNLINMSLGVDAKDIPPGENPFEEVMDKLLEKNIIPIVAAGNSGPEKQTICSPGDLENVLTVGAYDPITGNICDFSSRGPTLDGRIKPDCVAPGQNILSASVGLLDKIVDGKFSFSAPLSGTSMATPHVCGLTALMTESFKDVIGRPMTLDDIKNMLSITAKEEKNNVYGWGEYTWDRYLEYLETEYSVVVK